jgi:O-antigen/teichoic acid export membrane protein
MGMLLLVDLSQCDDARRIARTQTLSRSVALAGFVGLMALPFPAATAIPWLLGPSYARAVSIFLFLLPGCWAWAVTTVVATYFPAVGRPGTTSLAILVGFVVLLAGTLALTPTMGALGAACATSVGQLTTMVACALAFARSTGTRVRELLVPSRADLVGLRYALDRVRARHHTGVPNRGRGARPGGGGDRR